MLLLLFLAFSVPVANPKKLLYTVDNPGGSLLNRERITKRERAAIGNLLRPLQISPPLLTARIT